MGLLHAHKSMFLGIYDHDLTPQDVSECFGVYLDIFTLVNCI